MVLKELMPHPYREYRQNIGAAVTAPAAPAPSALIRVHVCLYFRVALSQSDMLTWAMEKAGRDIEFRGTWRDAIGKYYTCNKKNGI